MVSEALFPGYSTNGSTWWTAFKAAVPADVFFHDFPILWLLPSVSKDQIADSTMALIDAVDPSVPRIFLSHMPVEHFEFELASRTRLIYILREPHAVWRSVMKYQTRLVAAVNDILRSRNLTSHLLNETMHPATFTWDFNRGAFCVLSFFVCVVRCLRSRVRGLRRACVLACVRACVRASLCSRRVRECAPREKVARGLLRLLRDWRVPTRHPRTRSFPLPPSLPPSLLPSLTRSCVVVCFFVAVATQADFPTRRGRKKSGPSSRGGGT